MKAQSRQTGKLAGLAFIIIAFLTISFTAEASYYGYNRHQARKTINKTAYIIDEAYSIANYYGYWSGTYLSRAVYYNEYAQDQFHRRNYRRAVQYSIKAREYALRVIDGCDSYWDYYYYENYGWSRNYGYNPYYSGYYGGGNYYGNYNNYYNTYYHTSHNNYYNTSNNSNNNYNPNRPTTYNDGRGGNGRTQSFDPNKPSTGGAQTGHLRDDASFKNIDTEKYFDKEEITLIAELPTESNMEETFRKDNKSVSFNDNNLRTNTKLIENNRSRSQDYKQATPEAQRGTIKLQEPKKIEEVVRTREAAKGVRTQEGNRDVRNDSKQNNQNLNERRVGDPDQRRTNGLNDRRMNQPAKQNSTKQVPNRTINQNDSRDSRNIKDIQPSRRETTKSSSNSSTREVKTQTKSNPTQIKRTETKESNKTTTSPTRSRR
ncbi:MAG TPA: hypothetical protein GX005_03340 [Bacteroidales bacterium]|nr:hypothetical protein [Bacteroidales bacterium]